jgi:hypothetical protein
MLQPRAKKWGWQAAISGAAFAYLIFDMATTTEAQSSLLVWMNGFFLVGTFLGCVGALWMLIRASRRGNEIPARRLLDCNLRAPVVSFRRFQTIVGVRKCPLKSSR